MPNQMKRPGAAVLTQMPLGELATGFFRRAGQKDGSIYLSVLHGREAFHFPILEDGNVDVNGTPYPEGMGPSRIVDIIHINELGKTADTLRWSDGRLVFVNHQNPEPVADKEPWNQPSDGDCFHTPGG